MQRTYFIFVVRSCQIAQLSHATLSTCERVCALLVSRSAPVQRALSFSHSLPHTLVLFHLATVISGAKHATMGSRSTSALSAALHNLKIITRFDVASTWREAQGVASCVSLFLCLRLRRLLSFCLSVKSNRGAGDKNEIVEKSTK